MTTEIITKLAENQQKLDKYKMVYKNMLDEQVKNTFELLKDLIPEYKKDLTKIELRYLNEEEEEEEEEEDNNQPKQTNNQPTDWEITMENNIVEWWKSNTIRGKMLRFVYENRRVPVENLKLFLASINCNDIDAQISKFTNLFADEYFIYEHHYNDIISIRLVALDFIDRFIK